jgi:hypothetical protein
MNLLNKLSSDAQQVFGHKVIYFATDPDKKGKLPKYDFTTFQGDILDKNNTKYIKRFEIGEAPPQRTDEGFTEWMRGTGPFEAQALHNVTEGIRKACKGVPKTPEQKQKMRDAKLGVPKSQEHKDNMRKSWYKRRELQMKQESI